MDSVICKFSVQTVEHQGYASKEGPKQTGVKVNAAPVYKEKTDPHHENSKFWDATPQGQIWLQINNPNAFDFFQPGEEFFVVITKKNPFEKSEG